MNEFSKITILWLLSTQFISCDNDKLPSPKLSVLEDKIVCENCYGFGSIIEADGNDLVISDTYQTIYIFERQNHELKLTKTIGFEEQSGILSVVLKDGLLIFSHPDEDGIGIVYIYEKRLNDWENIQELTIGRPQDDFGSAIDISSNFLVIGASAPYNDAYNDYNNTDEGRIYIYKKTPSGYVFDSEFKSHHSFGDDRFGKSIAIHEKYILAGSSRVPLHIYHFDGEWRFLRTEPLKTSKIVHHENNFIAKPSGSFNSMLYAFILNENGTYENSNLTFGFTNDVLSDHGEILDIYETQLLFALDNNNYCFEMEYFNNVWTNITKTEPTNNQSHAIIGLEITKDKIYMGGNGEDYKDYVYIIDY